jgi:hypothetical protein
MALVASFPRKHAAVRDIPGGGMSPSPCVQGEVGKG